MPELPEVEIVKRSLKNNVKYKKIKNVIISNRNLRFKIQKKFENTLKGRLILSVERFSKYIILTLSNNKYCLIHLGMSGTLHLVRYDKKGTFTNLSFYHSKTLPKKHNHIKIKFSKFMIVYNDPRRFGFFKIFNNQKTLKDYFSRSGPEATSNKFNYKYLKSKLINKEKNIKSFLLDQNYVSGIGNIYANEILFYCKINPQKKCKKISRKTTVNRSRKSRFKKAIKKMNLILEDKNKKEALTYLPKLNSELMKIAKTGIIKKENAARNISRITKKINSL